MDRYVASWRDGIMAHDRQALRNLHRRIFCAIALVVLVSTIGFCLTDLVLYGTVATSTLGLLAKAGDFRPDSANFIFTIRSMFLAAQAGDETVLEQLRISLADLATSNGAQHVQNFESCPDGP